MKTVTQGSSFAESRVAKALCDGDGPEIDRVGLVAMAKARVSAPMLPDVAPDLEAIEHANLVSRSDSRPVQATRRRLASLAATLAFLGGTGWLIVAWIWQPTNVYRAFAEVQEMSVRSPAAGTINLMVAIADYVERDQAIANVGLPEFERQQFNRQCRTLSSRVAALATRRDIVSQRLIRLHRDHARLIRVRQDEDVARLYYESVRDNGLQDYREGSDLAQEAAALAASLSERLTSLQAAQLAAPVESIEATLRMLSWNLQSASLAREDARVEALSLATGELREATQARADVQAQAGLAPDFLHEIRLLEQIDQELAEATTQLDILEDTETEHIVRAPCAGRVLSVATATHLLAGEELATIACSADAHLRVQLGYEAFRKLMDRDGIVRFRLPRSNHIGEARVLAVQRGLIERDRRLREIDLVEILLMPTAPIPNVVLHEQVEILR